MTVQKKFMFAVAVPLGLSLVFLACLALVELESEALANKIDRTRHIVTDTNTIIRLMYQRAAVAVESQLKSTADSIARTEMIDETIKSKLASIQSAVKENGSDNNSGSVERVQLLAKAAENYIVQVRETYYELSPAESQLKRKTALSLFHRILDELSKIADRQNDVAIKQQAQWNKLKTITTCFISGGVLLSIVVSFGIARLFYRDVVTKLATINANVRRIGTGEPLPPAMPATDELAEVDGVLHHMAARLAEARRKERAIFDNAADFIFILNRDLGFSAVSPSAKSFTGVETAELQGRRITDYVLEAAATEAVLQKSITAALRGAPREVLQGVHSQPSQSPQPTQLTQSSQPPQPLQSSPSESPSPFQESHLPLPPTSPQSIEATFIGPTKEHIESQITFTWCEEDQILVGIARNISLQKQLERTKAELSSMLMHDVRTPLSSHLFFLDLVATGALAEPSAVEGQARLLHSDMQRLLGLLDQLLDVQKLNENKLAVTPDLMLLEEAVTPALSALFGLAKAKGVTIESEIQDVVLVADKQRLTQVLVNLISNAIKYSARDSRVLLANSPAAEGRCRISVTDKGKGIPEEYRPHLFKRFTQAKGSESSHSSGLGLYICRRLIEAQGGTIGFTPLEEGSCFWIDMPTKDLQDSGEEEQVVGS